MSLGHPDIVLKIVVIAVITASATLLRTLQARKITCDATMSLPTPFGIGTSGVRRLAQFNTDHDTVMRRSMYNKRGGSIEFYLLVLAG